MPCDLLRLSLAPQLPHSLRPHAPTLPLLRHRHGPLPSPPLRAAIRHHKVRSADQPVHAGQEAGGSATDLPVELHVTYELDPVVTLRDAVERLREAVRRLRLEPPCSRSGVVRFEVRIPPSIKAASWFHSQSSSEAFPQFFLSAKHHESIVMASLCGMIGLAAVGAAICLNDSSHEAERETIMRYLCVDSPLTRAYGFVSNELAKSSLLGKHDDGLNTIFIPRMELNEFKDNSILALMVVWDDCLCRSFPDAIESVEFHLNHVIDHIFPASANKICGEQWLSISNGRLDVFSAKQVQMIYLNAEDPVRNNAKITEQGSSVLEHWQHDFQVYFRLSSTEAFTSNVITQSVRTTFTANQCPNINSVWASLIVEECVRLGLMYFCIAPGSRSSPLAIAAATHPQTTCISCFDERSLSFHAIGYAKGSHNPAVVITSSGTAVSNLLPAVVEASQDFVPVLLLTADRPPELHDTGANQTINQVDHFGKFVRFFFNLPPPSDEIPARMVLTTVDSAFHHAIRMPRGPVHINCPFREPLDNYPRQWSLTCLQGLDHWMSNYKPFTTYINLQNSHACKGRYGQFTEIMQIIRNAERGLLLIGSVESEDEIWAALLLAKHLSWPVVPDILSGLRLRKFSSSVSYQILFLDHLDHALLSDLVRVWPQPDVVLQLGSRLTSKRVTHLLEMHTPHAYILVEEHPCRHDPSHIVTHRIQSTITALAETLLQSHFPMKMAKWRNFMETMEMTVASELSIQIDLENSLTEPHVAHVIASALRDDTVLFTGNSMVIRDLDMYGSLAQSAANIAHLLSRKKFPFQGIHVGANRGASGIDGLLSSAVGFAAGCNKRVVCFIGDISFLHDTNGLAILSERMQRKPMTVLVINNHGGAIFSLLPLAERTESSILDKYFCTSHNISISKLCAAYSIKHLHVQTKVQLQLALHESLETQTDSVIEVESRISDNAIFHCFLRETAREAANHAFRASMLISDHINEGSSPWRISRMEYSLYRIQLSAPPTTTINHGMDHYREGFVLSLTVDDGSIGYGEVVPTEIHQEDITDVEEQLRFIQHVIEGSEIFCLLPLLRGSFSFWFWRAFGITPSSLFPSVRCGIEMALLHALANKVGSFSEVILGAGIWSRTRSHSVSTITKPMSDHVQICALVDCSGTPRQVAFVVSRLVEEGFHTIKLKVARRKNLIEDAAVVEEMRNAVGYQIHIRVDANKRWLYEEAVQFGIRVKHLMLQYIEEPLQCEDDIVKFCEETGVPVALDETIDDLQGNVVLKLKKFSHPGIVAIVVKPNVVGGFENAALIARWAHVHGKMVVISSTFESSLSLYAYVQFAHYLEQHKRSSCRIRKTEVIPAIAHGLGTYKWLKEDVAMEPFNFHIRQYGGEAGVFAKDVALALHHFTINGKKIQRSYSGEPVASYFSVVDGVDFSCPIRILETEMGLNKKVVVFLHGFLGTCEEWVPMMKALSVNAQCISLDIPGHGQSRISWKNQNGHQMSMSIEAVGDVLHQLLCNITTKSVILVGYSMGARIALYMSLKYNHKIEGAALLSVSPGLKNESDRRIREAQDDAKAQYLSAHGFKSFLEIWYSIRLWDSLREHPLYEQILKSREKHIDLNGVVRGLSDLSVGRQPSLWEDLRLCKTPLLLAVGEKDEKFKEIAYRMQHEVSHLEIDGCNSNNKRCDVLVVEGCGHALHLENPLAVINAVSRFFLRVRKRADEEDN